MPNIHFFWWDKKRELLSGLTYYGFFFSVGKEYHDQKYSKILFVLLKLTENDSTILFSHSFLVP